MEDKNDISLNIKSEKSEFEKLLTESSKTQDITSTYDLLKQSYEELSNYIEEIKNSKKISYILNSNIIDKISRLSQRNYININILISKILYTLLNASNFMILTDDSRNLILLCNISINILEQISSYELNQNLTKRIITFLKCLKKNSEKYLNDEQIDILDNIENNLDKKIISNDYSSFANNYQKDVIFYLEKDSLNEREKGILNLYNYFFRLKTLNEQFNLFCEYGYFIINSIVNKPNPCYIDLYYNAADFVISFVYNISYIIKLNNNEDNDDLNYNKNIFYLSDNDMDIQLENYENKNNPENLKFLMDKKYELDEQKTLLINYSNIFYISTTLISYLMIYESSFKCQYISYLIIKRLYFIFPQYRDKIEDLIPIILINLLSFKKEQTVIKDFSYENFFIFLLNKGSEKLKNNLETRLNAQNLGNNIFKNDNFNIDDIKHDIIYLNDINLRIGLQMNLEIKAGYSEERIIEIKYDNSLLYLEFNTIGMNINFLLYKFCPLIKDENNDKFYEVFKLEKSEGAKVVLFIKKNGIYKIVFDNKYSWFNNKIIRYRVSVLKEIEDFTNNINKYNHNININDNDNQ